MKVMNCPLNGPRNISEFVWGGEVKPMPDDAKLSDREWAEYVFLENNPAGQYGWIEDLTGAPMTSSLAEVLIAGGALW